MYDGLQIRVTRGIDSPAVLEEIGRIREREFSRSGGGTGKELDLDDDDLGPDGFYQMFAWDPVNEEIVSMYRYWPGWEPRSRPLPTEHLFDWSDAYRDTIWPATMELGRSVVNKDAKRRMGGLFAIWAGLGAFVAIEPRLRYFWGKVTVYPTMPEAARQRLHSLLSLLYPGPRPWVAPRAHLAERQFDWSELGLVPPAPGANRMDYLIQAVKAAGGEFPTLIHSYLALSTAPEFYGTALHPEFGATFETAMLIPVDTFSAKRRAQLVDSYVSPHAAPAPRPAAPIFSLTA